MAENNIVVIEDNNLASLLADEICGDPNNLDVLTKENLTKVTKLFAVVMLIPRSEEQKIRSLKGLEWCVNLKQLHLTDHLITDLSPLYNLNHLRVVNLRKNQIDSIYPLVEKTSIETLVVGQNQIKDVSIVNTLTGLKQLYVQENPLKNDSLLFVNDLPALRDFYFWETNEATMEEIGDYRKDIRLHYDKEREAVA